MTPDHLEVEGVLFLAALYELRYACSALRAVLNEQGRQLRATGRMRSREAIRWSNVSSDRREVTNDA